MINRLLIVDDSPIARKMLKNSIPKDKEYTIHEGANGQDAVDKFKEYKPDITFLDLTMPVMDGYDALKLIKQYDNDAIVIIVTADIQPKSLQKVMSLGAFTVIKKPSKKQSIQDALNKVQYKLESLRRSNNER